MKHIYKIGFILFTLFYLVFSALTPQQALAEGNPFVPTTDTLGTGLTSQIGGEELDTASVDIANFSDITGAYYDSALNRIVFIGTTTSIPKYNQDDMAVAIKSIFYNNVMPDVSIADDPNNPSSATAIVTYTNGLQNTNLGNVIFNTDYKYKQYAIGYDPNGVKVTSTVSTYKSVVDRYLALQSNPVTGNESKYILSPQTVTLKNSTTSSAFVFTNLSMQATAQPVNQNNDSLWNQAANNFASDITTNYSQYANESSSFAQTQQLEKIVSVLKWVSYYAIPTDFHSIQGYTPTLVLTPTTVQKVATPTGGYSAQGEINYNTPNTYIPDDGTATGLKASSQAASSSKEDVTWTFTNGGQQYQAVAITATTFKSLGAYNTTITDMSIPTSGDLTLTFQRSYSSFTEGQSGLGLGWGFLPARIYNNAYPVSYTICNSIVYLTKMALDTPNGHESLTYNCPGGYSSDDPAFHSNLVANTDGTATVTLSNQTKYFFNANTQLTSNQDKNGNVINYSYDGSGKLTGIADTHSHQLTIAYNAQNLISSVTDWSNRKVQYAYYTNGRLTGVTDPDNNTTTYGYDSGNRLTTVTDRTGQLVLSNTYGGDNRLITQKDASNLTSTSSYDNVNRIITQTDNLGRTVKTSYDSKARILQQTDPLNKNVVYTYGNENAPLTITDRNSNKTTYVYDSHGNTTSVTYPDNSSISYTYDSNNRLTKTLDSRFSPTKETDYAYDSNGNLTQKTEASVVTKYTYDTTGEMLTTTDPLNNQTTWTRDNLGDKLTQTDPYNNTTNFTYDSLGRLTKQTDASNNATSYTYDSDGNLLTKVDTIGTTTNSYDKENRLLTITLPNNKVTTYTYNPLGSLSTVVDSLNSTTTYGYDNYQNLTSQQDALNHTTTNTYDLLNRPTKSTTPLGNATNWTYDSNGNLTQRTDANNKTTNYQYDSLNRLTKITYPDNSIITYQYDSRGNMTSMTDPNGTSTYTYDNFERMTKNTNPFSQSLQCTYDNGNNLSTITYPDNLVVTYGYDKNNRMNTVTDWNNKITTYTYNNNGTLATRTYPNSVKTYYTYDGANRLITLEHKNGSNSLAKFVYQRDSVGNITSDTETGQFVLYATPVVNTFTYDNAGKIINGLYTQAGGQFQQANITYTYDAVGNILTKVDSVGTINDTYTYDSDNRILKGDNISFSYDNNGNQLTEPYNSTSLTYNFENNLTKYMTSAITDTYKYDGLGNRLESAHSSSRTRSITDITGSLSHVLEDYSLAGSGSVIGWYEYGLGLIATWGPSSINSISSYFLEDGMGNTRYTTTYAGGEGSALSYDPYGVNTGQSGNGFGQAPVKKNSKTVQTASITQNSGSPGYQFDEQHLDLDSGFYYLRARNYDPATGRFLTRDSAKPINTQPLSLNSYQYGFDSPTNKADPSWKNPILIALGISGAIRAVASVAELKLTNPCASWQDAATAGVTGFGVGVVAGAAGFIGGSVVGVVGITGIAADVFGGAVSGGSANRLQNVIDNRPFLSNLGTSLFT